MDVLKAIENAAHTAARWFLNAVKKTGQIIASAQPIADRVFPWVKLTVDGILVSEGQGAITAEANAVMDEIDRDLDVAAAALHDVGPTPKVTTLLSATASNIDALIAAGHVKNPANISLVKNVVASLMALLPAPTKVTP